MPFVSERPALQLTEDEQEYLNKAGKSRTLPKRVVERSKILLEGTIALVSDGGRAHLIT